MIPVQNHDVMIVTPAGRAIAWHSGSRWHLKWFNGSHEPLYLPVKSWSYFVGPTKNNQPWYIEKYQVQ